MAEAALQPMTVAEFLDFDDDTDTSYELVAGQPVPMSPPSERHTHVVSAIAASLYALL